MPEIRQSFKSYEPPPWLIKSVEKLLSIVPPEQIRGLEAIVLTDGDSIGKGQTQRVRGRKYARRDCRGFYHPAGPHNTAWIEIIIDNVFARVPSFAQALPFVREVFLGEIIYHEVGHHLQHTYGSAHGEGVAENWSRRLTQNFIRKHYRWLLLFTWPFAKVYRIVRRRGRR